MQYTIAAAALFAGLVAAVPQQAMTTSTVMVTDEITITSCGPAVTSCPARVSTTSYAVVTTMPVQAAAQFTSTILSTEEITITSCAETVTDCPARTSTVVHTLTSYPAAGPSAGFGGMGGTAAPSGTGNLVGATGAQTYHMPSATGYNGPSFTGAASHLNAGAALAGVGAIAALIL